jgi:hypothetical protein
LVPKVSKSEKSGKISGSSDKEESSLTVEVHAPGAETIVPAVGDVVTCKVLSVNPRLLPSY